jgi:hypothetical protein
LPIIYILGKEKMQKIMKKNYCEICDYSTVINSDFKKHVSARKHILREKDASLAIIIQRKNALSLNYNCDICNFSTMNKSNYNYHLLTKKHQKNSVKDMTTPENKCPNCEKEYMNYNALWKHKKTCIAKNEPTIQEVNCIELDKNPEKEPNTEPLQNSFTEQNNIHKNTFTPELFMEVLKQSKELQEVLVEQTKDLQNKLLEKENQLLEQNKELQNKLLEQNAEHNKQIIELTKTQTTNINTQNNQQFNLQFFLNETCKDAMNLVDFVNSLKLTPEDFETTGRLGYVDGISRIFIKELKKLNTEKLPIHCTDLKRETVYIKNNNIWEKENDEKHRLKWTIDRIADLNLNQHHQWQEKYPQCRENNTPENHKFVELTSVALGGRGKEQEDKFREKIMRNVIKEVVLDKKAQMVLV